MEQEKKLKIKSFSDVQYEPPEWLCKPYFPIGKLTLVQGDPGCGKTAFLCKMAALTSKGGQLLDKSVAQGNVLILSVEDDESTLRGRIEASGGDITKCFFIEEAFDVTFCHEGLQTLSIMSITAVTGSPSSSTVATTVVWMTFEISFR